MTYPESNLPKGRWTNLQTHRNTAREGERERERDRERERERGGGEETENW